MEKVLPVSITREHWCGVDASPAGVQFNNEDAKLPHASGLGSMQQ